jgi:hypothetical protein
MQFAHPQSRSSQQILGIVESMNCGGDNTPFINGKANKYVLSKQLIVNEFDRPLLWQSKVL